MFSIRKVKEKDAASIVELLNSIVETGIYTIMDSLFSTNDQIEFIQKFPDRGIYNVAVCNNTDRVLGVQDIQPLSLEEKALKHVGNISTFVSLDSHRKGVGRLLSHATFREVGNKGFTKISATVRADNQQAISFYQDLGFRNIGTAQKHALVRGKFIDEVLMEMFVDSVDHEKD